VGSGSVGCEMQLPTCQGGDIAMADLSTDRVGQTLTIRVHGHLDRGSARAVRTEFLAAITSAPTDVKVDVEVDVAQVSFLGCGGIGLLAEGWVHAATLGWPLTVVHPHSHTVHRVLDTLQTTVPFAVYL
jgi:anti-anti-sigma factor